MRKRNLIKFTTIFCLFIAFGFFVCNRELPASGFGLNVQEPFGFTWKKSDLDQEIYICDGAINSLRLIYTASEIETLVAHCKLVSHKKVILLKYRTAKEFRDGEIGVTVNGNNQPFSYTYSYGNDIRPITRFMRNKAKRAEGLKTALIEIYGNPKASGHYEQFDIIGFIPEKSPKPTCFFWQDDNVGILLCEKLVPYLDRTEVSLSFIKLDNYSSGIALKNRVNTYLVNGHIDPSEHSYDYEYKNLFLESVEGLSYWMDIPEKDCRKGELRPLVKAWEITDSDERRLLPLLEKYKGDDLAQFIFDNEDIPDWVWAEDNLILYLLKQAADEGSANAMNEFGYAQLRCALGVEKDLAAAKVWIEKAIAGGSDTAYTNRAALTLFQGPPSKETRQRAVADLQRCTDLNGESCGLELKALNTLNTVVEAFD